MLQAMGLSADDYDDDDIPEIIFDEQTYSHWDLFCAMGTQLRSSGAGAYGFDYNVLPLMFEIYKIADKEAALNDLRVMEISMIEIINKK